MNEITAALVQNLIKQQFPQWQELEVRPVAKCGHDNRTFHLGETMMVRLPSGASYVPQVEKEVHWLPKLKPFVSLPIATPIAKGEPTKQYPFPWSVNQYIEGESLTNTNIVCKVQLAKDLATFLETLQSTDTADAPPAGKHNFYRGGDLAVYHGETQRALTELCTVLPVARLSEIWDEAMRSRWELDPVWIHGDVAPGNLLVSSGRLCGVIDFGIMGIGDPACDYAMAWTFFDGESTQTFLGGLDEGTIARAKGWALWKALITYNHEDHEVRDQARRAIQAILEASNIHEI
ncbi:MAG: aminoglycoside phosphotransferase family protein [Cellulosilyticaceae bacterium]